MFSISSFFASEVLAPLGEKLFIIKKDFEPLYNYQNI